MNKNEHTDAAMEAAARSLIEDPRHCVAAVSAMAGSTEISAAEDIVSASGIKLVARGTRIDASLREKLGGHKLSRAALEHSLDIVDGLTPAKIADDITGIIDGNTWLRRLATWSSDPNGMRRGVALIKLPREILFRLTIAREQRPTLYQHSLRVTVLCHYLALRLGMSHKAIDALLIAALCHDLGELLTDPAILEPGHRISDEERRFVYVHPITGWMLVRDLPGLDPAVATAVLQHQERLDGSGYPYGRTGEAIDLPTRVLCAADVSDSVLARFSDHHRLSTLLRLNQKKFDRNVVGLLHEAIEREMTPTAHFESGEATRRLTAFAALFAGWGQLRALLPPAKARPLTFLAERMFNLRGVLIQFGYDPDSIESLLHVAAEDPEIAAELATIVDELGFQLADLAHEFDRRDPAGELSDPVHRQALADWRRLLQESLAD